MSLRRVSLIATVALVTSTALAFDVVPVGPFTGDITEGFENIYAPGSYPVVPVFDGLAEMTDSLANIGVITNVWNGPGGTVYPYNGNLMGGTPAGSTLFDFSTPVMQFGGYLSTVSDVSDGTITFRDERGGVIGSLPYSVTPTIWAWQGWSSDTPIKSIEVTGNGPFGNRPMQYDDLQVIVPEPGTLGLLIIGAGLLRRRR
jgi:hypothetical protein